MADGSKIEWTDATWNPITGCTLVSEGCRNCYAAELAAGRLSDHPSRAGLAVRNAEGVAKFTGEVRFNAQWLDQPLRWGKPRQPAGARPKMIFVCAHGDLFHESVPYEWIDKVFAVMALCSLPRAGLAGKGTGSASLRSAAGHTFQVLTKRPERARAYLHDPSTPARISDAVGKFAMDGHVSWSRAGKAAAVPHDAWPLPNVWLGTSVEDQATADARIPELLAAPAAVRFVSAEPLLGPVDLTDLRPAQEAWLGGFSVLNALTGNWHVPLEQIASEDVRDQVRRRKGPISLDWVIAGGESGRRARPMHPDWACTLRDQCAAAPTPERSGSARSEGEEGVPFLFKQWGSWAPGEIVPGIRAAPGMLVDWRAERAPGVKIWAGRGSQLDAIPMRRLGKKAAGRLLDGVEHNGFPSLERRAA